MNKEYEKFRDTLSDRLNELHKIKKIEFTKNRYGDEYKKTLAQIEELNAILDIWERKFNLSDRYTKEQHDEIKHIYEDIWKP